KLVDRCRLPLTAHRRVDLIVTELAVIQPTSDGLLRLERAPGVAVETIQQASQARLTIPDEVPEMRFD
ncbi:MAG: succinyl-CoA--3-ketoacid-CoA transferase, partial [Betaproteobacteria bacterium]|nr:succinyl-CoA--3-ketoacid-CoA transferase [Betaproteobacteria bacterium]